MSGEQDAKVQRRRRADGGRPHRHMVRATDAEEAQLIALAHPRRISIPKLLVEATLVGGADAAAVDASVREELMPALFNARRLLLGVANNVNQLARVANATGNVPSETDATLAAVTRTTEQIDDLLVRLSEAIR